VLQRENQSLKSQREHQQADLTLLGYTKPGVHSFIDAAVKYLGAGHRIVYHSPFVLDLLEEMDGKEARMVGLLHLLIDAKIVDPNQVMSLNKTRKTLIVERKP